MPATRDDLMTYLATLGIETRTTDHPPLFTVEQSQALRGQIPGAHTKNLFVKDKKGQLFLITTLEDARIDLKQIHHVIGASGRVSFGSADLLMETLGVTPGSVTAFGAINDTVGRVTVILDAALMAHDLINGHPLINTATTSIASGDLVRFLQATGHAPQVLTLPAAQPAENGTD